MSEQVSEQIDAIDVALAAYRDASGWHVEEITDHFLADFEELVEGLGRFPGDGGTLGMIAVDEDFFLLVRVVGARVRVLLSDVTAVEDWPLAQAVVDSLGLPADDEDAFAGDLEILADLGLAADELAELLDDEETFPDEALAEIAEQLGFGEEFDDVAGLDDDSDEDDSEDDDDEDDSEDDSEDDDDDGERDGA